MWNETTLTLQERLLLLLTTWSSTPNTLETTRLNMRLPTSTPTFTTTLPISTTRDSVVHSHIYHTKHECELHLCVCVFFSYFKKKDNGILIMLYRLSFFRDLQYPCIQSKVTTCRNLQHPIKPVTVKPYFKQDHWTIINVAKIEGIRSKGFI